VERIRVEGNQLFNQQNWSAAVNKYSKCVDEALAVLDNSVLPGAPNQEKLKTILMLA
jgi:hypothetical protein